MSSANTVAIILPCFQAERWLHQTMSSIQAQTYSNWKLILVDDASSDNSFWIASEFAKTDERILAIRLDKNLGAVESRNQALRHISSQYVAFCDSDDVWLPRKLETQLNALKQSRHGICCTAYQRVDEHGHAIGNVVKPPSLIDYQRLLRSNCIGMSTALVDTKVCGEIRLPKIKRRQDYALWLQLTRRGHKALGVQEPLVKYRVHRGSLSSNKILAAYYHWLVLRELEGLPLYKCLKYFAQYCNDAIGKRSTSVQSPSE